MTHAETRTKLKLCLKKNIITRDTYDSIMEALPGISEEYLQRQCLIADLIALSKET